MIYFSAFVIYTIIIGAILTIFGGNDEMERVKQ